MLYVHDHVSILDFESNKETKDITIDGIVVRGILNKVIYSVSRFIFFPGKNYFCIKKVEIYALSHDVRNILSFL